MCDIKQEAIEHYECMIKWAKKQEPNSKANFSSMLLDIGIGWNSHDCSYCQRYRPLIGCFGCALYADSRNTEYECCNGLWSKMSSSKTWKEWIMNAEKVLEYIKENG